MVVHVAVDAYYALPFFQHEVVHFALALLRGELSDNVLIFGAAEQSQCLHVVLTPGLNGGCTDLGRFPSLLINGDVALRVWCAVSKQR